MIITISGKPGSGKSSVAKMLSARLGMKHYSIGDLRRKWAEEKGMTLAEYNTLGEMDDSTDKDADDHLKRLGEEEDDFVIDARLGMHFIPKSFKVFLDVNPKVGARRIFKDQRHGDKAATVEEVEKLFHQRQDSDKKRYQKYYGIDPFDTSHYDLVIDGSNLTVEATVEKVLEGLPKDI
ncbi:MAG: (d)CMP kinase [Nanoarchaeota archaeon]